MYPGSAWRAELGEPIYSLKLGDWDYLPTGHDRRFSDLDPALRRPDTTQLFELLADPVETGDLGVDRFNSGLVATEAVFGPAATKFPDLSSK